MLEKPLDEQTIIKAAKTYLKEMVGIEWDAELVIVDPWYIILQFSEGDPTRAPCLDYWQDGLEVIMGYGKSGEISYFEIEHEQLLKWYQYFL